MFAELATATARLDRDGVAGAFVTDWSQRRQELVGQLLRQMGLPRQGRPYTFIFSPSRFCPGGSPKDQATAETRRIPSPPRFVHFAQYSCVFMRWYARKYAQVREAVGPNPFFDYLIRTVPWLQAADLICSQ
jgi:hypothetical protein